MVRLTCLDLTENNFARLPTAVKLLSKLQHLNLQCNLPLQLKAEDVDILAALTCLHTCDMSKSCEDAKSGVGWTDSSVLVLIAISKRLLRSSSWSLISE